MSEIFLKVLNMSISATYLVLAVLLLRLLIKKAPKWVSVLLWGIVAVRLICPVSIESILSLIPSGETVSPEIMMDWTPEIQTGISSLDSVVNPVISETFAPDPLTSANPLQILIPVAAVFWLTGVGIMLIYTAVSFLLLRRKVATAVRLRDRIYQSEKVASPFVLGIIRPKIYLPFAIDGQNMEYVIAHEMSHIRRKDHLWKPLGFLILTIHWFNPLMWIGYVFLCRDIELACDEKVIRKLDSDEKANYTQALVACSVGRLRIAACPLAFGEVGVKARVRSVMHYKKPAFWMIVAGIVISVAVAVCFLTNPKTKCYGETDREKLSDTQAALKGQYPAYFGLEATDGLDVYVWQMAGNSYSFGLKPHSKNHQEYLFDGWMDLKGISAAEMQEILATYPVEEEDIHIILWQHPLSSYLPEYCIVEEGEDPDAKQKEYAEMIRKMLFDKSAADNSGNVASQTVPLSYEKFLKGEFSATDRDGRKVSIQDYLRGDYNKFAVYDMNGDAVVELILKTGEGLTIFSVKEQGLTVWYRGTIYEKPLNNRAIFYERPGGAPEHTNYQYIVLDPNGEELQRTSFAKYYDDNAEYYLINNEKASKTDYEDLYKSLSLSDDAIVWKDISVADGTKNATQAYKEFLNGYVTNTSVLYSTKNIGGNGTEELILVQNTVLEVYTDEGTVRKVGAHDFVTGTLLLYHTNDNKYPGMVYVTVGGGKNHFGYITITDGALSVQQVFDDDYGMTSGKKEDVFYTQDEDLIALCKKAYQDKNGVGYSIWKPNPYAIREIIDGRVIMGEKYQTYKESFISLNIPLGWKCLERWGEDGRFLYFRDPIFGENCQLSIYSSGAMHYSHYTREDYMAHFTGYRGYEDVVIDSFSEETIQGFPCTKIVYSYTENNTRFVGIRYDSLNEGPRFYDFAITYPAAESKTYEEEFAAIIESVRFVKSNG